MKRVLAYILTLSLIMTLFLPAVAFAGEREQEIFQGVTDSALWDRFNELSSTEKMEFGLLLITLDDKDFIVDDIFDKLDNTGSGALKSRLLNNGIDREAFEAAAQVLSDLRNEYSIVNVLIPLLDNSLSLTTEVKTGVTVEDLIFDLRADLTDALDEANTILNSKIDDPANKVEMTLDLLSILLDPDYVMFEEQSDGSIQIDLDIDALASAIDSQILGTYFSTVNPITENEKTTIEAMYAQLETRLNDEGIFDETDLDLVKAGLDAFGLFDDYTAPGGGGGSGGGGGGAPADDDDDDVVVTVPEDDDEPVEAEIGEDAVETEENEDGQTEATVKEEAITKAVESIVKAIEEAGETTATKNAAVTIPVKANDENLVVKLPSKAMTSLAENNVGLNIKSEKMEYNVPAGAIDEEVLEEFGEEVTVQFNSKKVNVEEAFKDIEVAPEFAMKDKIIELSLDVLDNDGKKVGSISEFKKPLTIKISLDDVDGDPDRLGVYFINPETKKPEFVGGKVVNGMLVFKVSHYSRYAVMEANKTYPDLAGHWSKANVESMAAKHVVSGYPDGTYKPENNITRAEFANLIVKALELDLVEYNNEFNDINAADWYADVVATAYANGIIDGYPEGTFLPNKEISRLEMAAMLSKALDVEINDNYYPMAAQAFGDYSDIASWGKDHMVKVYQEGLMVGMDGVFNPTGTTTRAQAATAIYRLYNK